MNRRLSMTILYCGMLLISAVVSAQDELAPSAHDEIVSPVQDHPVPPVQDELMPTVQGELDIPAQNEAAPPVGDAARGRLVFGPCRTCHYAEESMGHNNGPNLHRIFGKVVGKQEGFDYYSEDFKAAQFVWTPELMYVWLQNPMAMFPASSMMSLGVPDPQQRADLIEFLKQASVREP